VEGLYFKSPGFWFRHTERETWVREGEREREMNPVLKNQTNCCVLVAEQPPLLQGPENGSRWWHCRKIWFHRRLCKDFGTTHRFVARGSYMCVCEGERERESERG